MTTADGRFRRLSRDTLYNIAGLAVPAAAALLVLPVLSRQLGPARFALLGMAWALQEYLTLFDAGIGRATQREVGARLAAGETGATPALRQTVAVAVTAQLALGVLGGVVLWTAAEALVVHGLRPEPGLAHEAAALLRVLAVQLPVLLLLTNLRAILEGAARFDLANAIKVPSATVAVLVPAAGAAAGLSLPAIFWLVLAVRAGTVLAHAAVLPRALPGFAWTRPRDWTALRTIAGYGTWVFITNLTAPVLVHAGRFVLGARAGLAAAGLYTGPFELSFRLLAGPLALVNAIFPSMVHDAARGDRPAVRRQWTDAIRYIATAMVPIGALLAGFAEPVVAVAFGAEYVGVGVLAMQLLAIGMVVSALAFPSFVVLQAVGRPQVPALVNLLEAVVYVPAAWWLVGRFGVGGAAGAWLGRVAVDGVVLTWFAWRATRGVQSAPPYGSGRSKMRS